MEAHEQVMALEAPDCVECPEGQDRCWRDPHRPDLQMEHQCVHIRVDYGLGQQGTRDSVEDDDPGGSVGARVAQGLSDGWPASLQRGLAHGLLEMVERGVVLG